MSNGGAPYDLIVIGGGSAGLFAASFAVRMGGRVALAERGPLGGDCTWTGCVPSKALLKAARVAHDMRHAEAFGLCSAAPEVDLGRVMAHVRQVVEAVYEQETPDALRAEGIDLYEGTARFVDTETLEVGEDRLRGGRFVVCSGASPVIPNIPGLREVDFLTHETIWEMTRLPDHMMVLGAGPIGCEMAQAFVRFGAEVTLLEAAPRILPRDEPEASSALAGVLSREGVRIVTGAAVDGVRRDGDRIRLQAGGEEHAGDALLVATGRRPTVHGLGLEAAGVDFSEAGIRVDDRLRTSQPHIYAAGDCLGTFMFTHYASWQAVVAARNALLPGSRSGVKTHLPWTTFTEPEVAQAGRTEADARRERGDRVAASVLPMTKVARARAEDDLSGFIKVVHDKNGEILGASIVAARAGEAIQEWINAMERGLKIGEVAEPIHPYPSYCVANQQLAAQAWLSQLLDGPVGAVSQRLISLRRFAEDVGVARALDGGIARWARRLSRDR